jgi:hypothetical protein
MMRVIIAAVPMALALAVCIRQDLPPAGDEPHYLIIADSVASDGDLKLENNYEGDSRTRRMFRYLVPHVYNVPRGWIPAHMPGLGILLAIPLALASKIGVRVALILLAGALPWTLMSWLEDRLPTGLAASLTLGLTLTFPFLFAASQIYPDVPGGVIVTVLAVWLITQLERGQGGRRWAGFWLIVGLLPWLHVKFIAPTIVFSIGGVMAARRIGRPRRALDPMWTAPLVLVGIGSLAAYHQWAYGSPFGPRGTRELTTSISRATMMFLGLHLDQSQGMFVQQPFLLAGVASLAAFVRMRPGLSLFWLALYASAIVPNSLQLARYGGGGPVGRFGWTAAWLWTIPLGVVLAPHRHTLARYLYPAVVVSLVYQAALAMRWLPAPQLLFPRLNDPRDSLFPATLRPWLPSFYFWDFSSYWWFAPNVVAMAIVALVVVAGALAIPPATAEERPPGQS